MQQLLFYYILDIYIQNIGSSDYRVSFFISEGKRKLFWHYMPKGKPHKTKCINVPQEASSITGNQQNVPSDYFKYLLYSVFLFKLVLLMSYLKKLMQKKSKRESQALKKSTLEIHWSWKHQLNRMTKETCRLVDRFKLLMQISILARLHAFKLETSFDVSFLEICDWISFILKT